MIARVYRLLKSGRALSSLKHVLSPPTHSERAFNAMRKALSASGMNVCYNKYIKRDYDPTKSNVLLAIEAPAVVENEGWLSPEMKFDAEISFGNFYGLDNYICCRDLYVANDFYQDLDLTRSYDGKADLVALVYSDKQYLPGHQFRHEVANTYRDSIDLFGSGVGKFASKEQVADYMYQVVVENGKYPDYVSEKFFDCLKTKTVPVYWGGEESLVKMGFDLDGVLCFSNLDELGPMLEQQVTAENYKRMLPSIEWNLARLVELRNSVKMGIYQSTVMLNYLHTYSSYHLEGWGHRKLKVELESIPASGNG